MNFSVSPLELIYQAVNEGHSALLLSGRNLGDLDSYTEGKQIGQIGPLLEIFRGELRSKYGMVLITYSRAEGVDFDPTSIEKEKDQKTIETILKSHNLQNIPQDEDEIAQVIRGVASLCRTPTQGLTWLSGEKMRFCFLLLFAEHLIPCNQGQGQSDTQIIATELSHLTAQSLALRSSGNMLCFHVQEESLVDALARTVLYSVRLPQPNQKAKQQFLEITKSLYTKAKLEDELTWEKIAFLTSNTPNSGLESLLRASHRTGKPVTARELVAQKSLDVQAISEQTLTVLDTSSVSTANTLQGINSAYPQTILQQFAKFLAVGNPSMPANVLLVGPPGTGKTEMSLIVAKQGGVASYQMNSPKTGIVGETERKAALQQRVLKDWKPNVAFVDEITEALPLERSDFDGDSGATKAVGAALLTALADESRRGQCLLIATTNCPWRMGAAMRSRFVAIPVLQPLPQDYPVIVTAIAHRLQPENTDLLASHPNIIEATDIFAQKGANPRHIRSALSNALLLKEKLTPDSIIFAAKDLSISTDSISAIYSDLWAIKACTSKSFLPWNANPESYPFPAHLQGIINPKTGEINQSELEQRIEQFKSQANL